MPVKFVRHQNIL